MPSAGAVAVSAAAPAAAGGAAPAKEEKKGKKINFYNFIINFQFFVFFRGEKEGRKGRVRRRHGIRFIRLEETSLWRRFRSCIFAQFVFLVLWAYVEEK